MGLKDLLKQTAISAYNATSEWAEKQQSQYEHWSSIYGRMGRTELKTEYERHKADIAKSSMRKKAFLEACDREGISHT